MKIEKRVKCVCNPFGCCLVFTFPRTKNSLNLICSKKKCYNGISRRCWLSRTHKINRLEAVIRHGQYKNPIKYLHNLQTRTQKKYIMIYGVLGEKFDKYQAAYEIEVCLRNPFGISVSFGE